MSDHTLPPSPMRCTVDIDLVTKKVRELKLSFAYFSSKFVTEGKTI